MLTEAEEWKDGTSDISHQTALPFTARVPEANATAQLKWELVRCLSWRRRDDARPHQGTLAVTCTRIRGPYRRFAGVVTSLCSTHITSTTTNANISAAEGSEFNILETPETVMRLLQNGRLSGTGKQACQRPYPNAFWTN